MEESVDDVTRMFRLDGQLALITGGGTGIGFAIAKAYCAAGGRVVLCGRRKEALEAAVGEIGSSASAEQFDVTETAAAPDLIGRVTSGVGPIDTLINNAGVHLKKPALDTDEGEMRRLFEVHVVGAQALTRAVLPSMRERKRGSILYIVSMAALFGIPQVIAYSAAKSADMGVVRTLATEVGGDNIRVNSIAPGFIETEMMHRAVDADPERKHKILSRTSLQRFGTPDDVGLAAVYLSSPAAAFITGTCLVVDGGVATGF